MSSISIFIINDLCFLLPSNLADWSTNHPVIYFNKPLKAVNVIEQALSTKLSATKTFIGRLILRVYHLSTYIVHAVTVSTSWCL